MSIVAISSLVASRLIYPELILKTITSLSGNLISSVHYLKKISENDIDLQKLLNNSDITQDILIIKSWTSSSISICSLFFIVFIILIKLSLFNGFILIIVYISLVVFGIYYLYISYMRG